MHDQDMSKAARLQKIVHLLYRNPRGLTTHELSKHCQVTVRTVQRDLNDLEAAGRRVVRGGSWYDRPKRCTSSFRLSFHPHQKVFNTGFRVVRLLDPGTLAMSER